MLTLDGEGLGRGSESVISRLRKFFGLSKLERSPLLLDSEDDLSWMDPPRDPRDAQGWNEYWDQHFAHGIGPPLFDMFCDDRELIAAMVQEDKNRILCAGNGCSMEPRALAAAGFDVTAVDLSRRALEISMQFPPSNQLLNTFFDMDALRPGGRVEFVIGDLFDTTVASGPFDMVIERLTAQTYPDEDRSRFLAALAGRLASEGVFFSHCHDNRWKPGTEPHHATRRWFQEHGWPIWNGGPGRKPTGRVAWLFSSTG